MSSFEARLVKLVDDGQIILNCDEAKALVREVRGELIYDVDSIPDGKMVRVLVGDNENGDMGNRYLDCGDIGFFTWKVEQEREDGFFLNFNDDSKEWCYVDYEEMEECEFELITDEIIELDCYED